MNALYSRKYRYSLDPRRTLVYPEVKYKGHKLTNKQVEVLAFIGEGYSNLQISKILFISKRTLEHHIKNIKRLIEIEDQTRLKDRELVLFAREMYEGYQVFMRLREENENYLKTPKLIEDWDLEDDLSDDFEAYGEEPRFQIVKKPSYEITDFTSEEKEVFYLEEQCYLV